MVYSKVCIAIPFPPKKAQNLHKIKADPCTCQAISDADSQKHMPSEQPSLLIFIKLFNINVTPTCNFLEIQILQTLQNRKLLKLLLLRKAGL